MRSLVVLKMVPDVVGGLEVAPGGKSLDLGSARMVPNESDEYALEAALLLKERHGGKVTVLGLDAPDIDDVLFAALAKGADRAIRISGAPKGVTTSKSADIFAQVIGSELGLAPADLILCGAQAIDDLDGLTGPLIACRLGLPFLGVVTALAVDPTGLRVLAIKEYPAGVRAEFEVRIPAVFGIQAVEKPPRYTPIAKVWGAKKSHVIECIPAPLPADVVTPGFEVLAMRKPQIAEHAEILEGSVGEMSARLCEILAGRGLI